MDKKLYDAYIKILEEELVPAMGCTEPIAIAYGAALARETLGEMPEKVIISASGNIIKNVKKRSGSQYRRPPWDPCGGCRGCGSGKGREKTGGAGGYYAGRDRKDQQLSGNRRF